MPTGAGLWRGDEIAGAVWGELAEHRTCPPESEPTPRHAARGPEKPLRRPRVQISTATNS